VTRGLQLKSMINFVTALNCEAQPLINLYRLKASSEKAPFRIYSNETMRLIISGIGKVSASAATSYLYAISDPSQHHVWINIGVAGHRYLPTGEGILAHKVTDAGTRKSCYPTYIFKPPCDTSCLETYDKPVDCYPPEATVDMEASGFYETACRFSTTEFIHCFKVISDNEQSPLQNLDKHLAEALIKGKIDTINCLVDLLTNLSQQEEVFLQKPNNLDLFLSRWHFSVSEQFQLLNILKRLHVCSSKEVLLDDSLSSLASGKDVLRQLKERLEASPLHFL
ncbi:MAG: adenosylhomocysteine nucleosidase, partial [Chlamydiales bacterium]